MKGIDGVQVYVGGINFYVDLEKDTTGEWTIAGEYAIMEDCGDEVKISDWSYKGRALRQHILDSPDFADAIAQYEEDEEEGEA